MDLDTRALENDLAAQDNQALLVGYSRLFLTPPYAAHLDLGSGVDGEQMGRYALAMAQTLTDLGLQLPEDSHEHPDYLPLMLEVALYLEDEKTFGERRLDHLKQLLRGLAPLHQSLDDRAPDSPWYQLALLTNALVQQRLSGLGGNEQFKAINSRVNQRQEQLEALTHQIQQEHRNQTVPDAAATRARQAGIPAEAILAMIANLEAQGLDTSHLRGQLPAEDWSSLIPPEVKPGRDRQSKTPNHQNTGVTKKS